MGSAYLSGEEFMRSLCLAAFGFVILLGDTAKAATLESGTLKCEVKSGVGFIIGSTKDAYCVFYKTDGTTEAYHGTIKKFGLDIGFTSGGIMAWQVLASTTEFPPGELAGAYVGVDADASLGLGAGAKVLVGGSNNTVSLQPLSLQGQTGINVAVALAELDLDPLFGSAQVWEEPAAHVVHEEVRVRTRYFKKEPHYGCGAYFIMREGDTLSKVARLCGMTVEAILDENPDISNTRQIPVGTYVDLPSYTGGPRTCEDKAILQPGEYVDELAERCNVSFSALVAANPQIQDPRELKDGMVLTLPES